jgi:hypothetical protein
MRADGGSDAGRAVGAGGAAKAIFNEHRSVIDCTVRNLSNSGACLQVSSPVGLPETFELSFDSFRSVRRYRVRWRAVNKIGVSFG